MDNSLAIVAILISGAVLALNVFDRVWGGGRNSAKAAEDLKLYTDAAVAQLRKDVFLKHDDTAGNVGQALQALKDMAHQAEIDALKFRAWCSENYIRDGALVALKTDVEKAFEKIDTRLERMEDIMIKTRAGN